MKKLEKDNYTLVYNRYRGCLIKEYVKPKYMVHVYKKTANSYNCVYDIKLYHGMNTKTLETLFDDILKEIKK